MKKYYLLRPVLAICLFVLIVWLSINFNLLHALILFSIMGLFLIARGHKTSKLSAFLGLMLLSPLLLFIFVLASFMFAPALSINAWCMLTCNGYEIPKESSIFTFRETKGNDGNGEYWMYGEDDKYYYGVNVDEIACDAEFAPEYFILRKGQESENFNSLDYHTWDKRVGVGWIPKELRSYDCREQASNNAMLSSVRR